MSLLTTPAAVRAARQAVVDSVTPPGTEPVRGGRDADTAIEALLAYHAGPGRTRLARRIHETLWTAGADAVVTALVGEER